MSVWIDATFLLSPNRLNTHGPRIEDHAMGRVMPGVSRLYAHKYVPASHGRGGIKDMSQTPRAVAATETWQEELGTDNGVCGNG
jgi:hypothetical protein